MINETYEEDKNGVKRETLLEPWGEVEYFILKYITCKDRMSIVRAYHFKLLHQLRNLYY